MERRPPGATQAAPAEADPRALLGGLERLGSELRGVAGATGRLLATWATGGRSFVSQALNLGLSIRRHVPDLERSFLVISLDEERAAVSASA